MTEDLTPAVADTAPLAQTMPPALLPQSSAPAVPAGWHPHPDNPGLQRYWDGSAWTEHTAPAVQPNAAPAAVATPRAVVASLASYPGFWMNLITLGIARASWIASTNRTIGLGGAGALFAWFLLPFAQYGVAGRLNIALRDAGSGHQESPFLVFLLSGWPFIGSKKRLGRAVKFYNGAIRVRSTTSR